MGFGDSRVELCVWLEGGKGRSWYLSLKGGSACAQDHCGSWAQWVQPAHTGWWVTPRVSKASERRDDGQLESTSTVVPQYLCRPCTVSRTTHTLRQQALVGPVRSSIYLDRRTLYVSRVWSATMPSARMRPSSTGNGEALFRDRGLGRKQGNEPVRWRVRTDRPTDRPDAEGPTARTGTLRNGASSLTWAEDDWAQGPWPTHRSRLCVQYSTWYFVQTDANCRQQTGTGNVDPPVRSPLEHRQDQATTKGL